MPALDAPSLPSAVQGLFSRIIPAPEEWLDPQAPRVQEGGPTDTVPIEDQDAPVLTLLPCTSYSELLDAWDRAARWTDELDIALSVMLAVVASTKLLDDQVFLRLIAKAGTMKTTLCEALSVNRKYVFATSKIRGLHSGAVSEDGKDHSLFSRMLDRTTIFNEGDMLVKNPNVNEILAELRDVWSGVTRCDYRNGKRNEYHGIRASVILAGTSTLRQLNRSSAGDRFLDVIAYKKESDESEVDLVRSILDDSFEASLIESNGCPEMRLSPEKIYAYRKTGGFVQHLRESIGPHLQGLYRADWDKQKLNHDSETLGRLVAHMRTRPTGAEEDSMEPELHVRLSKQLRKLAVCLSCVMGTGVTDEVMRRTAKVAKDTCFGSTWQAAKTLFNGPLDLQGMTVRMGLPLSGGGKVRHSLGLLNEIGCARQDKSISASGAVNQKSNVWRLTPSANYMLVTLRSLLREAL